MVWGGREPLSITYPHLLEEWDYDKNTFSPKEVARGSHKKAWWKCREEGCQHEWEAAIYNRVSNKSGCPACVGKVVTNKNSLAVRFPDLCKEWDYKKNFPAVPEDAAFRSGKKVFWRCKKCNHSWKSFISGRTKKEKPSGCPACSGRVPTENNNLVIKYPHLLDEWDFDKNTILPFEVTPCSHKKVWWVCCKGGCGHSWKATVGDRTNKNSSCPKCSNGTVSKISQEWLDRLGIKIREYHIKDLGFRVDGFDPETNTVYEFFGDYWHGNPEVFSAREINSNSKKPFGALHEETLRRLRRLEKSGYKVVYIWERDYKCKKK